MKLNESILRKRLGLAVSCFDSIDSTNLFVKRKIESSEAVSDLVIASHQTDGRGRTGKSFYSPAKTGLYLTYVIKNSPSENEYLTARVALATAAAIDAVFGVECGIKWVNDIYLNGRKVAGILCQTVRDYTLIGIGINVEKPSEIPRDLVDRFGFLVDKASENIYQEAVCELILQIKKVLSSPIGSVLDAYRARCIHIHHPVSILHSERELCGICVGIADDFSLLVEINGKVQAFTSGMMNLRI